MINIGFFLHKHIYNILHNFTITLAYKQVNIIRIYSSFLAGVNYLFPAGEVSPNSFHYSFGELSREK